MDLIYVSLYSQQYRILVRESPLHQWRRLLGDKTSASVDKLSTRLDRFSLKMKAAVDKFRPITVDYVTWARLLPLLLEPPPLYLPFCPSFAIKELALPALSKITPLPPAPYVCNMDIHRDFPGVHWIWGGGISFVYEVHPCIVVKIPKSGDFEKQQFNKELEIYQIFSQNPPCPSIVQCFYFSSSGIFLEYMRGATLASSYKGTH